MGELRGFRERTQGRDLQETLHAEYSIFGNLNRLSLRVDYNNPNGD